MRLRVRDDYRRIVEQQGDHHDPLLVSFAPRESDISIGLPSGNIGSKTEKVDNVETDRRLVYDINGR
jgi:hypothetical protein